MKTAQEIWDYLQVKLRTYDKLRDWANIHQSAAEIIISIYEMATSPCNCENCKPKGEPWAIEQFNQVLTKERSGFYRDWMNAHKQRK